MGCAHGVLEVHAAAHHWVQQAVRGAHRARAGSCLAGAQAAVCRPAAVCMHPASPANPIATQHGCACAAPPAPAAIADASACTAPSLPLQMYCSSLPLYYELVIDSDEGEVDSGDAGAPHCTLPCSCRCQSDTDAVVAARHRCCTAVRRQSAGGGGGGGGTMILSHAFELRLPS